MNKIEIRNKFKEFIGEQDYTKFYEAFHYSCRSKNRLLYWMEKKWNGFSSSITCDLSSFELISSIFMYCNVHGCELKKDRVKIIYGTFKTPTEKEREKIKSTYPFSNELAYGPCWVEEAKEREVDYCESCRKAKKKV